MLTTYINITNEMNEEEMINALREASAINAKKVFSDKYMIFNYTEKELNLLYKLASELDEKIINALKDHNENIKEYIDHCNAFVRYYEDGRMNEAIEYSENVIDRKYPYIQQISIDHSLKVMEELSKVMSVA